MSKPLVLVVDDEPDIRELLAITLGRMDVDSVAAENVAQAKQLLRERAPHLCLTDMRLPDGNGIELVRHMQQYHGSIPVAVITAHGNMELAVEALKAGAFDFVSKPVDLPALRNLVATALRLADSRPRAAQDLTGASDVIEKVRQTIAKLARSQAPVYISGESGTGKERVARMIHQQGARADGPFIPVNCGAIPADLMESEFFGHRKGSFTGAVSDKSGLFQAAQGGTLFLDEVGELPIPMQVKLLRAIQEKNVRPVGAQHEEPVDVRILSATHKDLARLVREGVFRQDLYYRINVIELNVPPLRQRPGDIPLLAERLLAKLAPGAGLKEPRLSAEAMAALQRYPFPGNVRELENVLERALTLSDGELVQVGDLGLIPVEQPPVDTAGGGLEAMLESVERQAILAALEEAGGNKTQAARILEISFRALRYRMEKLGIE